VSSPSTLPRLVEILFLNGNRTVIELAPGRTFALDLTEHTLTVKDPYYALTNEQYGTYDDVKDATYIS
jgi:hypothetical protein